MSRGLVAVVGRPNVGKSTLFNRLVGDRVAIVEDEPGTTRDRLYATTEWRGREFTLIDTAGLAGPPRPGPAQEPPDDRNLDDAVRRQAEAAIDEADVVVFVVDAKEGVLPVEHDVADRLRRSRKAVVLAEKLKQILGDPATIGRRTKKGDMASAPRSRHRAPRNPWIQRQQASRAPACLVECERIPRR